MCKYMDLVMSASGLHAMAYIPLAKPKCVTLLVQVNFRGSTGYGKSFLHAGDKQWGTGDMQNDLTDAVQWAIDQGIADAKKIAIYGGSYGMLTHHFSHAFARMCVVLA